MHVRRRVWHTGAVLTATAGIVLLGSAAQADCGGTEQQAEQWQAAHWQVGMQLGPAPVALTGMGGLPAVLLGALPESRVAVEDARGRNLLRLNASSRVVETPGPAFSDDLSHELPDSVGLVDPAAGTHVAETDQAPASAAAPAERVAEASATRGTEGPTQQVDRASRGAVAAPAEVALQSPGSDSVLGGQYAWVPIEGVAGLEPGPGVPWAGGLALLVLIGGAGALTVVARHRHASAG